MWFAYLMFVVCLLVVVILLFWCWWLLCAVDVVFGVFVVVSCMFVLGPVLLIVVLRWFLNVLWFWLIVLRCYGVIGNLDVSLLWFDKGLNFDFLFTVLIVCVCLCWFVFCVCLWFGFVLLFVCYFDEFIVWFLLVCSDFNDLFCLLALGAVC